MNKRTILLSYMDIDYERNGNGTTLELRNDADWMVYGADEGMTLQQIATELLEELKKFKAQEAGADEYYERYDPEFIRDAVDALNEIIEEEK